VLTKIRHHDYHKGIHIEAYTDGYSIDQYGNIFLLSVVGQDSAVKAITAAAVTGKELEILEGEDAVTIYTSQWEKHRILSAKLGSGCLHQILLKEALIEKRSPLVFIPGKEKVEKAVFNKLQKVYALPALPAWSEWLYQKLLDDESVKELEGNIKIVRLDTGEKALDELISEGVRNQELRFPERR